MVRKIMFFVVAFIVAMQLVPYGKNHTNPKVESEVKWDSVKTKELFMRACGDCHSNETKWPKYSEIAPVSWLVYIHVEEGRKHFNVSMWGKQKKNKGDEAVEEVQEGEMPLVSYLLAHPEAKLTENEKAELIKGLRNTFGEEKEGEK
jgi:mono/diheme cytochrome c family protein